MDHRNNRAFKILIRKIEFVIRMKNEVRFYKKKKGGGGFLDPKVAEMVKKNAGFREDL